MEELVNSMILDSAKRLELDPESALILTALDVGRMALDEGYDVETAFSIARDALIRATQPSETVAA